MKELEKRVNDIEDTLLESMRKDNEIHKLLHEQIDLLSQRIYLLEQRLKK